MRRSSSVLTGLAVASMVCSCATPYRAYYRETNHSLRPAPIPAEQVKVVKSEDDLITEWMEVGLFRGHAPTVVEGIESAQTACGRAGADYFILLREPYDARGHWKVDGFCAARSVDE